MYYEPRFGAPRKVTEDRVEKVVLESKHRSGQTDWSTRGLAQASGLSRMTISRICHAFGLQPHRADDPQLIEKVYMYAPEHVLYCVDEKSQIQALERTQPLLPLRPGAEERGTHDYKRHGTSLIAVWETKTSRVIGQLHRRQSSRGSSVPDVIESQVPGDLEVH